MRAGKCRACRTRSPSSRSELTEINIRQEPGFAGLLFFSVMPSCAHELENPFRHARAPVAFRDHVESVSCDNSIVPLLSTALRVTFLAPVVLRGANYCTGVVVSICEKHERNGCPIRRQLLLPASPPRRSYPSKAIPKNFVSLITYPHSERKHFENWSR